MASVRFGFALLTLLTGCELLVSTSNLDNGKPASPDAGEGGVALDADVHEAGGVDAADDHEASYCASVVQDGAVAWCDDFDRAGRQTLFTNGWSLTGASSADQASIELAPAGAPVVSAPRSVKLTEVAVDGTGRPQAAHVITLESHNEIHFEVYRPTGAGATDNNIPFLETDSPTCTVTMRYADINVYCPDYLDVATFPPIPTDTWVPVTIVIDNDADAGASHITVSAAGHVASGTAPFIVAQTLALGQGADDFDQTVYFDNVYFLAR